MFITTVFIIVPTRKYPILSTKERINKLWYNHSGTVYSNQNERMIAIYNNMDESHKYGEQMKADTKSTCYERLYLYKDQMQGKVIYSAKSQNNDYLWGRCSV